MTAMRQDASTGQLVEDNSEPAKAGKPAADTLHVKVWSPFKVYFDSEAASVSGVNATGPFDILPQHRNFITLLNACDLIVRARDGDVRIRISGGVMHVRSNKAIVFLEV